MTLGTVVLFKCRGITGDAAGKWVWTRHCQSEELCSAPFFRRWALRVFWAENLDDGDDNQQDTQKQAVFHRQWSYVLKYFRSIEVCWNSLNLGWNVQCLIHIVLSNKLTWIPCKAGKDFCNQPWKDGWFPEDLPQEWRGHCSGTWFFRVLDPDEEIHSSVVIGFGYNMHTASWVGPQVVAVATCQ